MESRDKDIFLTVSVIATVISLVAFLLFKALVPTLVGTTLDEQFLSSLRTLHIFSKLSTGFLYMFLFSAGAALAFFIRRLLDNAKMVIAGILLLLMALVTSFISFSHAVPAMFNKPVVKTVTVVNKDAEYRGGKVKRTHYFLYFSNYSDLSVSKDKYDATKIGDEYYLVMCGSNPISSYSSSEYRLP